MNEIVQNKGPVRIRRAKGNDSNQRSSLQIEKTLEKLSKTMDVGNEVLSVIKKSNVESADTNNDYRILQMLHRDSQEFKEIMKSILRDRRERSRKKVGELE